MTLGKRIKYYREKKGVSAYKMSKLMGYTQSTISLWETDKFTPSLIGLIDICTFLDITPNDLLDWKGNAR